MYLFIHIYFNIFLIYIYKETLPPQLRLCGLLFLLLSHWHQKPRYTQAVQL